MHFLTVPNLRREMKPAGFRRGLNGASKREADMRLAFSAVANTANCCQHCVRETGRISKAGRDARVGALEGIRILDLSQILAGPFATQLLGDLGADVIKVERPGQGDDTRGWRPPYVQGPEGDLAESAYYLSANRNKRSLAVDMSTPQGAALIHRDRTGEGQHIDIALADATMSWLVNAGTNYLMDGREERCGNAHPNIVPYQVFECADGHLIVAAGNDAQFARFCGILGREEGAGDGRFFSNWARLKNREILIAQIAQITKGWRKDALIATMEAESVPGGPINTLQEVFDSAQCEAREMKISLPFEGAKTGHVDLIGNPVKFAATPVQYRRAPPKCGAQTEEILNEWLGEDRQAGD